MTTFPKQQPWDVREDLELGVEDATKAVGGDTTPSTTQKPAEYQVVKFQDLLITSTSIAP